MRICRLDSRDLPAFIDAYLTGELEDDGLSLCCDCCANTICPGDTYYDVDGTIFCQDCCDDADKAIADAVRDEYTYEL